MSGEEKALAGPDVLLPACLFLTTLKVSLNGARGVMLFWLFVHISLHA